MWRSITNLVAEYAAYVAVIAWEALTAAVLVWAAVLWVAAHRHGAFGRARRAATLGYLMALVLWVGGFMAIGVSGSPCGSPSSGTAWPRRCRTPCSPRSASC
jgi:predicted small integral membrane protein